MLTDEARREREQSMERRAPSARVVYEALRSEGASELERAPAALLWSGFAAGISIGLSLLAEGALRAHLPDAPWRPLLTSFGYTAGFIAVTLGRQQLFTETTVTACLPLLNRLTPRMFVRVLRFWFVVLSANLLGALFFAWTVSRPTMFDPELQQAFTEIGLKALDIGAWTAFVRGIVGGWIIALMVWLQPAAEGARLWTIVLMTYLIAVTGLTHVIAGSVDVFYAILVTDAGWGGYVTYVLPVLLGNSIGGIVFVAILNHGQVNAGETDNED